jgi:hypothetical protein
MKRIDEAFGVKEEEEEDQENCPAEICWTVFCVQ